MYRHTRKPFTTWGDLFMVDSFRKRDPTRPANTPLSPYGRMQDALSPAPSAAPAPKPEPPKAEPARSDAAPGAKPANQGESASKLIVGPDIKLKGAEITDCDTLVVEGRVEAAMESRTLQIAEIGEFLGKAAVDTAEIHGHFDGELTVRKQLVIRATGHVSGKIRYGKLSIDEGGELSGDIDAMQAAPASADQRAALAAKAITPQR